MLRAIALDVPGFKIAEGIWLGEGAEVDPGAQVAGPAIIGDYCRVEAGAHLQEYTVLGTNVVVENRAGASGVIGFVCLPVRSGFRNGVTRADLERLSGSLPDVRESLAPV